MRAVRRFLALLFQGITFASSPASSPIAGASSSSILELLRELYGEELGPVLLAVGDVESRLDPWAIGDDGQSRGGWQVNTSTWGSSAAPMPREGESTLEALERQARAMRPAVEDAAAGAVALARLVPGGIPFAEGVNLVWQFGRPRARQILLRAGTWNVDLVARAIDELRLKVTGAAWKVRQAAFAAALAAVVTAIRGVLVPLAFGAGAGTGGLLVLFLLWLWSSNRRSRRRRA